jgi:hypothetical protein
MYRSGRDPEAVIIDDMNGDGAPDVVTANSYSDDVSIFVNDGTGVLSVDDQFPVGRAPASVEVADLDNDGRPDVATTNGGIAHGESEEIPGSNSVSVWVTQGDGRARDDYPAGKVPMGMAIADVNGDTNLDIVTVNRHSSEISLLLGKGDATFHPSVRIPVARLTLARRLAAADVNGDGVTDVVIPDEHGDAIVMFGNGDGTFKAAVGYPTSGIEPVAVAVGDVNSDGHPDIVTANGYPAHDVSVLLGHGDGRFGAAALFATGFAPHSVVIADLNGDGSQDIVTGNVGDGTVSFLAGHGDGTFAQNRDTPTGSKDGNNTIAVADMNGDGRLDVVTANYKPSSLVTVLLQATG